MEYKHIIDQLSLYEKAQMLRGKNTWQTQDFEKYGIKSIFLSDGPHGIRKQLGSADHLGLNESIQSTCFPTAATVANSWDIELAEKVGIALGQEARELGVHVVLGPGMNIKRNPLCGRNFEYFSEDPLLTGKMAGAYVRGIQSQGISACPKHFAVNSQELRRMSNDSIVDERTLREIYLSAFEYVVETAHPMFMMTSYNKVNGEYTNENHHLLQDILYGEWQYDGLVVTDWGGSNDHVQGVIEGSHLEMPGTGVSGAVEIEEAVKSGRLSEDLVDKRLNEMFKVIFKLTEHELEFRSSLRTITRDEHHELAHRVAQESIVLLKNKNKTLPLSPNQSMAFIGEFVKNPRYQGAGSSFVNATILDSIEGCLPSYGVKEIKYAQGYNRDGVLNQQLIDEAVSLAKQVEFPIIFAGLTEITESEGMDRTHMQMSQDQLELINQVSSVNQNTIVVLSGGSVVELPFINQIAGLVHSYLSGQAGSQAVLDVVFGKINPSGKLSESYPVKYDDVPSSRYYPGVEQTSEYREGIFVGYRYYNSVNKDLVFPFGFGLSYTDFSYSNIKLTDNNLSVTVTNTGDRPGAEVVQVYVEHESVNRVYAKQVLAGFKKIYLEVGQSETITIELNPKAFQYYNTATQAWEIDGGVYQVAVGKHSRDYQEVLTINLESTTSEISESVTKMPHYFAARVSQISTDEFSQMLGYPVPQASWNKDGVLDKNDTVSQLYYAKSGLARLGYKMMTYSLEKSMSKGKPNLNLYFTYNMTFRAFQKMMGNTVNHEMVDNIMEIVNGRFIQGTGKLIKSYFNYQKQIKEKEKA